MRPLGALILLPLLSVEAQQQFRLPQSRPLNNRLSNSKAPIETRMLTLESVLESVNKHYPPLRAALLERPLAEAEVLNQQGRFDLVLRSRLETQNFGFYQNERFDIGIEQPTTLWGATLFSGYSISRGRYPDYDGKAVTNEAGQYRAGARVPLARDRVIDNRRADLGKARIGLRLADLSIDQQRLTILQSATRRYWDWVAAGRRLLIANTLLDVALGRDSILSEAVKIGALPQFEQLDNQRIVLQRRNNVVEARRSLENAAIELSLFLRDDQGQPLVPESDKLLPGFPDPAELTESQIFEDMTAALNRRPDVLRFMFQRDQVEIDKRLAQNQRLPNVDLFTEYLREFGAGPVKRGPNDLRVGILFDLPLQRRQATARLENAEARLGQIRQRLQFQRDQVSADVRDAASAVRAAYERSLVLTQELQVTRDVEAAERLRFELGDSTLFVLNLREQATAEAAVREANALADYFRAYASYELAIARALVPGAKPSFTSPVNTATP
ncbi:MAG: TolC family protein [Bryobacter sp.]|jgi:cobalt-zinc-cadmium efflux system outer membrane protein|nr:TolC family protein [Bryobacter sp. CoA8 C33]